MNIFINMDFYDNFIFTYNNNCVIYYNFDNIIDAINCYIKNYNITEKVTFIIKQ